jgi:ribonucleoside-triphosphate reductase (thioredoxin)
MTDVLSEITVFGKYAKYLPKEKRRETFTEITQRYLSMMVKKYPQLIDDIHHYGEFIYSKKILPSMRAMQFAGVAIEKNESRIYNCAYLPVDDYRSFSEIMFLLLGGTGVGYSVQNRHIENLPEISKPKSEYKYLIGDSIEGWSDAIRHLMASYFGLRRTKPKFDFSDIREKGAKLITAGGKAPGPEPLKRCLFEIEQIFERKENGSKLSSIEVHDIVCHIANSVLAGGIRRAALIALFSADDEDMLHCKSGNWWELNPQRGRANNSAVLVRHRITKDYFNKIWKAVEKSNAGEPGIYFTNNPDYGTNPCCEISLRPYSFCNLSEINASTVVSLEDYEERVAAATFFGTLQAGFTDFHYLRPIWKRTTEKDALVGVGLTGIASGNIYELEQKHPDINMHVANTAKNINKIYSEKIGIRQAARITTIKPSGTTSCVLGTSSGIHAWHNDYYIRRQQLNKSETLYSYLKKTIPELVVDYNENPLTSAVVEIPQKAPDNAIIRNRETALELLERVKHLYQTWILPGHNRGDNTNNISATISVNTGEWEKVGEWMWNNKEYFNGLSVLPMDLGTYTQTPFEDITKDRYYEMVKHLHNIDLTQVIESDDNTTQTDELACAGGVCEIQY